MNSCHVFDKLMLIYSTSWYAHSVHSPPTSITHKIMFFSINFHVTNKQHVFFCFTVASNLILLNWALRFYIFQHYSSHTVRRKAAFNVLFQPLVKSVQSQFLCFVECWFLLTSEKKTSVQQDKVDVRFSVIIQKN